MKFMRPFIVILCMWVISPPFQIVHATSVADVDVQGFSQEDLDNDGRIDQAIIECACVSSHDRILVFDGAADMVTSTDWSQGTDTSNDTWIFDIQATDQARLIIVFQSEGSQQSAMLYDDVNGDGIVIYHVEDSRVIIDESPFWTLKVTSSTGWASTNQPDNQLHVWMDKPPYLLPDALKTFTPHDGNPDWDFLMTDSNKDSIPDYALSRIIAPIPQQHLFVRTILQVNSGGRQLQRPASALFWPFLDLQPETSHIAFRYFDLLPSVIMDWQHAQILTLKLPGYPIEEGFTLNSYDLLDEGKVYDATFEAPHAYYDLGANHDSYPELNIRLQQIYIKPWQEIRYSWNQYNPGTFLWDYKVGLFGYFPIDSVVDVSDLKIRMVSYDQLPYWVTEKNWQLTSFVARESGHLETSEGIYAWSPYTGEDPTNLSNPSDQAMNAAELYVHGLSNTPPYAYFTNIWEGYRGEYNFVRSSQPVLYFSPVDQRLHLKGAEAGILNLGDQRSVVYANTDGDDYIDRWILYAGASQLSRLSIGPNYLLYSDATQVLLKRAHIPFSMFETLPPRNNSEWLALGQKLISPDQNVEAQDLLAMFSQFSGQDWTFYNSTSSDFRNLDQGCRFILTVSEGYSGTGLQGLPLSSLAPGRYLVKFDQDTFGIYLITHTPLEIEFLDTSSNPIRANDRVGMQVQLRNPGLEDTAGAMLVIQAHNADNIIEVFTQKVNLLAGESLQIGATWQPTSAGQWELDAVLVDQSGTFLGSAQTNVDVVDQTFSPLDVLYTTTPAMGVPLLILLVAAALICGVLFGTAWSSGREVHKK